MSVNSNLQNILAMVIGATGEFAFAESAPSAALAGTALYPYADFGNLTGVDFGNGIESEKRFSCHRGIRREISTEPTLTRLSYKLKSNEADARKLAIAFNATETGDFLQAIATAADGDALDFAAKAAVLNQWYNLRIAGVQVRSLTTVTVATLVENTDFVVDKELGRIRFLTAQNTSLVPKITAPAIAADTMAKLDPMQTPIRKGYGRITFFDRNKTNKVVLDHVDFSCEVILDGNGLNSQDGKAATETTIMITVTDVEGTMIVRK